MSREEHPVIRAMERTGYPPGQDWENRDCPQLRAEYVRDTAEGFFRFVAGCAPELFDDYIRENRRAYDRWRN